MRPGWLKLLLPLFLLAIPANAPAQGTDEGDEGAEEADPPEQPTGEQPGAGEPESTAVEEPEAAGETAEPEADPASLPDPEPLTDVEPEPEPEPEPAVVLDPPTVPDDLVRATARVVCAGRVGAGLLVDEGRAVITLLEVVQLGYPVQVRLGDGHMSRGRITAVDRAEGLARVELEEPAPAPPATPLRREPPRLDEPVLLVGHGGATGMSDAYEVDRELITFSVVRAHVAGAPVEYEDLTPGEQPRRFLVDRSPGEGDRGAPIFDEQGRVIGMLLGEVKDGGGRSRAIAAATLDDLVAEPALTKPWRKRHHLQSWAGLGLVAHNRPSHLAGAILYGLRVVLLDSIRFEPWLEVDLGTRAPRPADDVLPYRQRDFWWSIETGLSVGYRIPMFVEGRRNYIVPTAGFRIGWNRFQHNVDSLVSTCSEGDTGACGFELERSIDQERSLRPGIDLGIDVRHGKMRLGYRFFLDPMAVRAHSMHRLVITFDGMVLPIRVGDSN